MVLITKKRLATTTCSLLPMSSLLASLLVLYYYYSENSQVVTIPSLLLIAASLVLALVVIAAARATMIAWITVLVLLAFAGNRRKVLVRRGSFITSDVGVYLFRVVVKERGLLALALVTFTVILRFTL